MRRKGGIITTIYIISNGKTRYSKSSESTTNYIILNLVFSIQHGVLQGSFLDYFLFNQLNCGLPKNAGQITAYSSRRLLYNGTDEISRSFPWNIFPFPILITDGLVSVAGIIIICLSSRFLNKDGNYLQKLLFHTLFIDTVRLFTLHARVAILSLKIQGNTITRILTSTHTLPPLLPREPSRSQDDRHAAHACQLPPRRSQRSQRCPAGTGGCQVIPAVTNSLSTFKIKEKKD